MSDRTHSATAGFTIPPTVLWQDVGGDVVLLNVETEQYYSLDPVGSRIVTQLTTLPFDAAVSALEADFDVDPSTLAQDIESLVDELLGAGLLRRP